MLLNIVRLCVYSPAVVGSLKDLADMIKCIKLAEKAGIDLDMTEDELKELWTSKTDERFHKIDNKLDRLIQIINH